MRHNTHLQYDSWVDGVVARDYMLYNSYFNVDSTDVSRYSGQVFAVRNDKYVLFCCCIVKLYF